MQNTQELPTEITTWIERVLPTCAQVAQQLVLNGDIPAPQTPEESYENVATIAKRLLIEGGREMCPDAWGAFVTHIYDNLRAN